MWPGTDTLIYRTEGFLPYSRTGISNDGHWFPGARSPHSSALWKGPSQAASLKLDHFLSFSDHPYSLPSKLVWCRYHSLKTCFFFFFLGFPIIKVIYDLGGWVYCILCSLAILILACIFETYYHKNSDTWSLQKTCTVAKARRTETPQVPAPTVMFCENASEKHIFS